MQVINLKHKIIMITLEEYKMLNLDSYTGSINILHDKNRNIVVYNVHYCKNILSKENDDIKQTSIFGSNVYNGIKKDGLFKSYIKKIINKLKSIKL